LHATLRNRMLDSEHFGESGFHLGSPVHGCAHPGA
jgi:hypothetical protein